MNNYEKLLYKSNRQKHQLKVLQDKCHKYKEILDKIKEIFKDYGAKEDIVKISMYRITGEEVYTILYLLEEIE